MTRSQPVAMTSEELIETLVRRHRPTSRMAPLRRLAPGLLAGALASILGVGLVLGFRPDLWLAMQGPAFWLKGAYTATLAALALGASVRLARPDPGPLSRLWLLALPALAMVSAGIVELAQAPASRWPSLWLGRSWPVCSLDVFMVSLPVLAGLFPAFRRLAPTHLRTAGACAGLAAGALGASIYGLHCTEASALFVLTWYSSGMILTAALGALAGPRLLRW